MDKRIESLNDFKKLVGGERVVLKTKKGKVLNGIVESKMSNRGYIDLNEIDIYIDEVDYGVTVNVDKYLNDTSTLQDIILLK